MSGKPSAVVGKRLPAWDFRGLVLGAVAIAMLLGSVWWVIHLMRGHGHLLDDGNTLGTVGGTALFVLAFIIGVVGVSSLPGYFRKLVVESECPRCGVRAVRKFQNPKAEHTEPTKCGNCVAYLRAQGDWVSEESVDACDMAMVPYSVGSKRYLLTVERDGRNRFVFQMPAICAVCGSPEASHRRKIGHLGDGSAGDSIVGQIVAKELTYAARSWQVAGPMLGNSTASRPEEPPSQEDKADAALGELEVPVCARHTEAAAPSGDAVRFAHGDLEFASYRYYLEFLAANHIDGVIKE